MLNLKTILILDFMQAIINTCIVAIKKITISSVFIDFTDKIYRCYNPVPTGSYEDLTKLYEELDKHSVVIEDRRNENLDEQ